MVENLIKRKDLKMIRKLVLVILISLLVATQSMTERAEQSDADEKVVNHFRGNDWGGLNTKSQRFRKDSAGFRR